MKKDNLLARAMYAKIHKRMVEMHRVYKKEYMEKLISSETPSIRKNTLQSDLNLMSHGQVKPVFDRRKDKIHEIKYDMIRAKGAINTPSPAPSPKLKNKS